MPPDDSFSSFTSLLEPPQESTRSFSPLSGGYRPLHCNAWWCFLQLHLSLPRLREGLYTTLQSRLPRKVTNPCHGPHRPPPGCQHGSLHSAHGFLKWLICSLPQSLSLHTEVSARNKEPFFVSSHLPPELRRRLGLGRFSLTGHA